MFEHYKQPLLPRRAFLGRLLRHSGIAIGIVAASLAAGMAGYHWLAHLSWIDALLNASMILGGMGPVNQLSSDSAKLFASIYALFSGMIVLVAASVLFAPIVHRFLHRFHIDSGPNK